MTNNRSKVPSSVHVNRSLSLPMWPASYGAASRAHLAQGVPADRRVGLDGRVRLDGVNRVTRMEGLNRVNRIDRSRSAPQRARRIWVPLGAALLVTVVAMLLIGVQRADAGGTHEPTRRTVVVVPGDTLWSIARSEKPRGDVRPLVAKMTRLNKVGATLSPGVTLVLP